MVNYELGSFARKETMKELAEKMAVILQWIYDDGEGGSYRPNIQEVLVAYNSSQQEEQSTQSPYFEWDCPACGMKLPSTETHCPNCAGTGDTSGEMKLGKN